MPTMRRNTPGLLELPHDNGMDSGEDSGCGAESAGTGVGVGEQRGVWSRQGQGGK